VTSRERRIYNALPAPLRVGFVVLLDLRDLARFLRGDVL
jgi:hypothetical protein